MEENIQESVRFFLNEEERIRSLYFQKTIVIFKNSVVFSSINYAEAYVWLIIDSFHNHRDFMEYMIVDLLTNTFLGVYSILWGSSINR